MHQNMTEVASKIPQKDGEDIKPWDPRITSEEVCSLKEAEGFMEIKNQRLTSLRLITKSFKSSGKADPVFLRGLETDLDTKMTEKEFCQKMNTLSAEQCRNLGDAKTDKCYDDSCTSFRKAMEETPFENLNFKESCKKVYGQWQNMQSKAQQCRHEPIKGQKPTGTAESSNAEEFFPQNNNQIIRNQIQRNIDHKKPRTSPIDFSNSGRPTSRGLSQ